MRMCRFMTTNAVSALVIMLSGGATAQESERTINLNLGFSEIVALTDPASTLVIGEPNIADVLVGPANKIVITPKSVGATNMIALDQEGREILRATLNVGTKNIVEVRFPAPEAGPSNSATKKYLCRPACHLLPQKEPVSSSDVTMTNAAGSAPKQSRVESGIQNQ